MNTVVVNLSRPGQNPQAGDRIRVTTTRTDGSLVSIIEYEFH